MNPRKRRHVSSSSDSSQGVFVKITHQAALCAAGVGPSRSCGTAETRAAAVVDSYSTSRLMKWQSSTVKGAAKKNSLHSSSGSSHSRDPAV
jgi:hypothetical protein